MIPQLLLGHFIADYPGQTDSIFRSKLQGWPGLLKHGGVVLVAAASATFPNTLTLLPLVLGMAIVHTGQDFLKVRFGDRWFAGPMIPYVLDQALHVALIGGVSGAMVRRVGEQSVAVRWTALVATGLIVVTWTYYITWRVALGADQSYAIGWRWPGKLERALAYAAGLTGAWWLVPLAVLPRLVVGRQRGQTLAALLAGPHFLLDVALGLVFSAALGWYLRHYPPL